MAYFLRLPRIVDLTAPQRAALVESNAISLSGAPGTGKSVVSVWRHIENYKSSTRTSILLTFTKSLKYYLAKAVESEIIEANTEEEKERLRRVFANVKSANNWNGQWVDEIIIDEAQDLNEFGQSLNNCQVQWYIKTLNGNIVPHTFNGNFHLRKNETEISSDGISFSPVGKWFPKANSTAFYKIELICNSIGTLRYLKRFAEKISYGADDNQILYPNKATQEARLREIFPFPNNKLYILDENFRNIYQILIFVKSVLKDLVVSFETTELLRKDKRKHGPKPILKLVNNEDEQNKAIVQIINDYLSGVEEGETHNIAILVPLGKPFLHLRRVVSDFYNCIKNEGIKVSFYTNGAGEITEFENVHVTTFKSSKGLEFDTVILPDFQFFENNIQCFSKVEEKDYYVAMTRAKRNLFLISDRELNFIDEELVEIETFTEINEESNFNSNVGIDDDLPF